MTEGDEEPPPPPGGGAMPAGGARGAAAAAGGGGLAPPDTPEDHSFLTTDAITNLREAYEEATKGQSNR